MHLGSFVVTFQMKLLILSSLENKDSSCTLKMEARILFENLVSTYRNTRNQLQGCISLTLVS